MDHGSWIFPKVQSEQPPLPYMLSMQPGLSCYPLSTLVGEGAELGRRVQAQGRRICGKPGGGGDGRTCRWPGQCWTEEKGPSPRAPEQSSHFLSAAIFKACAGSSTAFLSLSLLSPGQAESRDPLVLWNLLPRDTYVGMAASVSDLQASGVWRDSSRE